LGALATNHILTARDVGRNSRQNKGSKERTKKYIDGEKGEKKKKVITPTGLAALKLRLRAWYWQPYLL
jgi:hypothetical protein